MKPLVLSNTQRAELRARAHALNPVVMIGSDGLSVAVMKEIDLALDVHELIKVRVLGDDREQRVAIYERICSEHEAAPVQHIGKLLVIYRPAPEAAKAVNHKTRGAAPKTVKVLKPSRSGKRRPTLKKLTVFGNERVTAGGTVKRARPRQKSVKKQLA